MTHQKHVKVLFVCMGNICRSPTAHGVFQHLVDQAELTAHIEVDSAGTHAYHVGEQPDQRARKTAASRGIDLSEQRARQATALDIELFDYILAMDQDNFEVLSILAPPGLEQRQKIRLFMEFAPHLSIKEVPDPYFGGPTGFERVFDMVEAAAQGLLDDIRRTHLDL